MAEHSATKMARKTAPRQPEEIPAETTPSITEDLECDLDALGVDDIRGVCERLREESRRRTVALASAVHELRTPLAVMEGYMELLFSGKTGSLNEKQKHILEDMKANEKRLKSFIADFLTFAAIETKNLNMNFEVGDLNSCLSEVCSLWMPRFQQKGIALYFSPEQDLQHFPFDHLKLQHVVSNLIHNAWKFTPPRGTVWVAAEKYYWERRLREEPTNMEKRRLETRKLPRAARVIVSDTGPGIEPEFHQEIFNDFRKLSRGNASDSMGLGLSIARRLVNAHGGKIWVESKPGSGSKFLFLIPIPKA
ncbi:MAG: signal transduction histidine kinase [Acidobacteriaceae bacterium]|nr:signal transduction histidine kinase [Acidobacteriaceae bacterium]